MSRFYNRNQPRRQGAILILTAIFIVFLLGIIAFAVDIGYILLAKTQLQTAADSAALAAAATMGNSETDSITTGIEYAGFNKVGNQNVVLKNSDFVYGTWDIGTRGFTPTQTGLGNAVKVTARADATTSGSIPLFFGPVFNKNSVDIQASSVATTNPRDICFVIDLSSSMNDDTDPASEATVNGKYAGVGTQMLQNIFTDFGYGTYPGTSESIGAPFGYTTLSQLTSTTSSMLLNTKTQPVTLKNGQKYTVPSAYQFKSTDSSTVRNQKAYSWVMDVQLHGLGTGSAIPGIMPKATPVPNSANSDNYAYWQTYIANNSTNLGYKSYLALFEPCGNDLKPVSGSTLLSPMSLQNTYGCPMHTESTDGGTFSFPPREMPTHSTRRSLISALAVIKERNEIISNVSQRDWVSLVTFSVQSKATVIHDLSGNYDDAMLQCSLLQSTGTATSCTATETGLMTAITLLNTKGRAGTNKVVVLLTDGKPNLYTSSTSTIASYRTAHPNSNFYGGTGNYAQDAAMMQASIMQGTNWIFFPVELGMQGDATFMNRIYSIAKGKTNQTDTSPYEATGDPTNCEAELKSIFQQIISSPKIRLVQ